MTRNIDDGERGNIRTIRPLQACSHAAQANRPKADDRYRMCGMGFLCMIGRHASGLDPDTPAGVMILKPE